MPTDPLAPRLRLAIVLGLLLLVGLTALNLLQAASGLRKDNARSLNHARAMIESAINDSQSLVEAARPLAMGRCQDEQLALRDLITAQVPDREPKHPDVQRLAEAAGLDAGQTEAAAAIASVDPLVIVEGAAGSGKTTMLATAIQAANERGGVVRVGAPTKKAADVAHLALGAPADSVAALVHAHGYRWNRDGVWTRLAVGNFDPETGRAYTGAPEAARAVGVAVVQFWPDYWMVVLIAVIFFAGQFIEGNILTPMVQSRTADLPPA